MYIYIIWDMIYYDVYSIVMIFNYVYNIQGGAKVGYVCAHMKQN